MSIPSLRLGITWLSPIRVSCGSFCCRRLRVEEIGAEFPYSAELERRQNNADSKSHPNGSRAFRHDRRNWRCPSSTGRCTVLLQSLSRVHNMGARPDADRTVRRRVAPYRLGPGPWRYFRVPTPCAQQGSNTSTSSARSVSHRSEAPHELCATTVRLKCRRSTIGASENRNRSKSLSATIDQGTQDGTTTKSPLTTRWAPPSRMNTPEPSKT